jgi:hypothetical protein
VVDRNVITGKPEIKYPNGTKIFRSDAQPHFKIKYPEESKTRYAFLSPTPFIHPYFIMSSSSLLYVKVTYRIPSSSSEEEEGTKESFDEHSKIFADAPPARFGLPHGVEPCKVRKKKKERR